jgi:hypothetical protein
MFKSLFLHVLPLTLVAAAPLGGYVPNRVVVIDAISADSSPVALLVDMLQQTLNVANLAITVFHTLSSIRRLTAPDLQSSIISPTFNSTIVDGCSHDCVQRCRHNSYRVH